MCSKIFYTLSLIYSIKKVRGGSGVRKKITGSKIIFDTKKT